MQLIIGSIIIHNKTYCKRYKKSTVHARGPESVRFVKTAPSGLDVPWGIEFGFGRPRRTAKVAAPRDPSGFSLASHSGRQGRSASCQHQPSSDT